MNWTSVVCSLAAGATVWLATPTPGVSAAPPASSPPPLRVLGDRPLLQRARLAAARLTLGSSQSDLVDLAAACNRAVGRELCRPETFALELRPGPPRLVPSFFLDVVEVSLGSYNRCVRAGRCSAPRAASRGNPESDPLELPVVGITQSEASQFCAFAGGRLPSEDEFERAARGPNGRLYPWGNLFHTGRLNGGAWGAARTNSADGFERLAPVWAFADGQSPEGIRQLLGNAEEWTASEPDSDAPSTDPGSPPPGPSQSAARVLRGGHFADPPWFLRATSRRTLWASSWQATLGFRCAKTDPRSPPRDPR